MRLPLPRRSVALTSAVGLAGALVLLALVLLRGGFTSLDTTSFPVPPASARSWPEVFARPPRVKVEPLITGTVSGDRYTVLDPDDPNLHEVTSRFAVSQVLAYRIHHPQHGDYLVDAGLSRAFADGAGNYRGALELVLRAIGSETRQRPGQDAAAQLRARGLSPRAVLLTHLHADHTSGLADLDCEVSAVFGAGEDTFIQKALMGDHLACHPLLTLDFADAPPMPPFDRALDVFGDGSLWAISTPGHSPAHVSYLVHAQGGPLLITGDAAAYHDQLEHRVRPAPGVHDPDVAARSLDALADFVEDYPEIRVAAGHQAPASRLDPTQ